MTSIGPNFCLMWFRILDSAQAVWENAEYVKYYATMFREIESIFAQLGFNDDVCK